MSSSPKVLDRARTITPALFSGLAPKPPGCVYFIAPEPLEQRIITVGWAVDPVARMYAHQRSNPAKLVLLNAFGPAVPHEDKKVHPLLAKFQLPRHNSRRSGTTSEWFLFPPGAVEVIQRAVWLRDAVIPFGPLTDATQEALLRDEIHH